MSELLNPEPQQKKKGLGRGLGSLLSGGESSAPAATSPSIPVSVKVDPALEKKENTLMTTQPASQMHTQVSSQTVANPVDSSLRIWNVAIDRLQAGKYQPRKEFDKEALNELAQSIKQNGILQPIVARRDQSGRLEIIAGERRFRAAQLAGMHEVPVILKEYSDKETLELALIENIQRADLNPIEEAAAYSRLIEEFALTQQQVAERVGKDRATVANALRVLSLPVDIKEMIIQKTLSIGHAKVLLSLSEDQDKSRWAKKAISEKFTVRQLEKAIAKVKDDETAELKPDDQLKAKLVLQLAEDLQKHMGRKVTIDYAQSKGKISLYFYSDEELNEIADRLKQNV
ncbi:MAG: ParB/RepB/Spo0J family partition protein [Pseudobdellovibrionaceae bacterium]